jgi:ribosomal protein L7Ae-like RNA K-turn-binding protein
MTDRQLRLLGLGVRAGSVVIGTAGVRAGLQRGDVKLVVVAADAGSRTEEKVVRLAKGSGVPTLAGPAALELGRRVGRPAVQAVGVRDATLVAGMLEEREPVNARRP